MSVHSSLSIAAITQKQPKCPPTANGVSKTRGAQLPVDYHQTSERSEALTGATRGQALTLDVQQEKPVTRTTVCVTALQEVLRAGKWVETARGVAVVRGWGQMG
jgi:hypothetical protein